MDEHIELDVVIVPEGDKESRVYSISSTQVPNVVTQGKTVEEAIKRLREALELYFEEMPEEKDKIIDIFNNLKGANKESYRPIISKISL